MKLRNFLVGGLMALLLSGAAAVEDKNPLNRQWLVILSTQGGKVVGVDPKSFKVVKPQDIFTFDMVFIGPNLGTIGQKVVSAQVSTIKVTCEKMEAQVMADTAHDEKGSILARDEVARVDTMGPMDPTSPIGIIAGKICSGQSLGGKRGQGS